MGPFGVPGSLSMGPYGVPGLRVPRPRLPGFRVPGPRVPGLRVPGPGGGSQGGGVYSVVM